MPDKQTPLQLVVDRVAVGLLTWSDRVPLVYSFLCRVCGVVVNQSDYDRGTSTTSSTAPTQHSSLTHPVQQLRGRDANTTNSLQTETDIGQNANQHSQQREDDTRILLVALIGHLLLYLKCNTAGHRFLALACRLPFRMGYSSFISLFTPRLSNALR